MRLTDECPDGKPLWALRAHVRRSIWGKEFDYYRVLGRMFQHVKVNGEQSDLRREIFVAYVFSCNDWLPHHTCPLRGKEAHPEWWKGNEWVGKYDHVGEALQELGLPLREKGKPQFEAGALVRVRGEPQRYQQRIAPVAAYALDDGRVVLESELELAPEPLPEDHIDRFWIRGAWVHRPRQEGLYVVLDERFLRDLDTGCRWTKEDDALWCLNSAVGFAGWSFHPDSPIQTPREPT